MYAGWHTRVPLAASPPHLAQARLGTLWCTRGGFLTSLHSPRTWPRMLAPVPAPTRAANDGRWCEQKYRQREPRRRSMSKWTQYAQGRLRSRLLGTVTGVALLPLLTLAACAGEQAGPTAQIEWVNFLQFRGIQYVASTIPGGRGSLLQPLGRRLPRSRSASMATSTIPAITSATATRPTWTLAHPSTP